MKIRLAFTADERRAVERVLAVLRQLLPGAKVKEAPPKDGFTHIYIFAK